MIQTRGLTHINLRVADLARARRFYETVFGFQEAFEGGPDMAFLTPPGTDHLITLQQTSEGVGVTGNIDHFGFRLADKSQLDQAIDEVVKAGGAFLSRGEHEPGHPFAYVTDPDGHVIEF
jgi:catechol 2,3-dioxygenase-like lactoylglutathione lyase family enzyme